MTDEKKGLLKQFPGQFWLVVIFEFFERGSYYGMMSFLSVYFVDTLNIPKESVGVIKGVIQPLLYFLPIISGALADRFGYRRLLMIAFTLLGGGYFLTSQAGSYGAVFAALVIMGFGAGTFKPLISGTIARSTDESNSTLGFGIFYWSINLGAFLFPLILVPFLKAINPTYVIIASAICTAMLLIPTAFFYKDPVKKEKMEKRQQTNLIQTLANAFEIIYSPVVLIYYQMKNSTVRRYVWAFVLVLLTGYSLFKYIDRPPASLSFSEVGISRGNTSLIFNVDRDMLGKDDFRLDENGDQLFLTIYKPGYIDQIGQSLMTAIRQHDGFEMLDLNEIQEWISLSDRQIDLGLSVDESIPDDFQVKQLSDHEFAVLLADFADYTEHKDAIFSALRQYPVLAAVTLADCDDLYEAAHGRRFFLLFIVALVLIGLKIVSYSNKTTESKTTANSRSLPTVIIVGLGLVLWFIPGISLLGRIITTVIYLTVSSLFIIDKSSPDKFVDHGKFLLMIFLYSGFWILYFQMFDSVLWYVKAYVDAGVLNSAVNGFLGIFGVHINWFFDVEHVTVINAGTIILLQLFISRVVKNTRALPTMMIGIAMGTVGMAILAINTSIWIFIVGIVIFSVGEMTAHPKFISYVGLVAPKDRKAMYMGYLFLYGVFGSSIGGIVGAKLYVHFVDNLHQPRTLWLIFSMIGILTIVSLFLYNKFLIPKETEKKT